MGGAQVLVECIMMAVRGAASAGLEFNVLLRSLEYTETHAGIGGSRRCRESQTHWAAITNTAITRVSSSPATPGPPQLYQTPQSCSAAAPARSTSAPAGSKRGPSTNRSDPCPRANVAPGRA